jgi:hypothetical protein
MVKDASAKEKLIRTYNAKKTISPVLAWKGHFFMPIESVSELVSIP